MQFLEGICLIKLPPPKYASYTTDFQADWLVLKVMSRSRERSLRGFDLWCGSQLLFYFREFDWLKNDDYLEVTVSFQAPQFSLSSL